MSVVVKWWYRAAAAVTGATLALVVPVHAWAASNGVADVAIEAVRARPRRRGFGFFGVFGLICCLVVVAVVAVVVLLVLRGRKRK
jgi:hypothetical protein